MSEEHKNFLRKDRDEIEQNLNPERPFDNLNGADFPNDDDLSAINADTTRQKQVQSLLNTQRPDDDEGFPKIREMCQKTEQKTPAALLEPPTSEKLCS